MEAPVLVTGASGFVGPWLLDALAQAGHTRLVALGEPPADPVVPLPPMTWVPGDMRDAASLDALITTHRPGQVYHLAAQASVADALADPVGTFDINATGTVRLLDALRRHAPAARMLLVSSAEVYGPQSGVLREDAPQRPANPYAASKAAAEQATAAFARSYGLQAVIARPFNHTGPGQSERFAPGAFAAQIARIEHGSQPPVMRVGNLDARRDFLDVRDVVAAYLALVRHGTAGAAYNVCSGQALAIRAILDGLLADAKLHIEVKPDPALMRPADIPELYGDATALKAATGWTPHFALDTTLHDMLESRRTRMPVWGDAPSAFA